MDENSNKNINTMYHQSKYLKELEERKSNYEMSQSKTLNLHTLLRSLNKSGDKIGEISNRMENKPGIRSKSNKNSVHSSIKLTQNASIQESLFTVWQSAKKSIYSNKDWHEADNKKIESFISDIIKVNKYNF